MSLDTLLEAAEFLEWSKKKEDERQTQNFHPYAKAPTTGSDTDESTEKTYELDENGKEKRRSGGAGTREVHNKLEKNRRAHLKECFDYLKKQIPNLEDRRTSNLSILRGSLRFIQMVKRKEREYEQEMQKLVREKIALQGRCSELKAELAKMNIEVDLSMWVSSQEKDQETNSTSTVTEIGSPIMSEDEDETAKDDDTDLTGSRKRRRSSPRPKVIVQSVNSPLASKAAILQARVPLLAIPPRTPPKQIHSAMNSVRLPHAPTSVIMHSSPPSLQGISHSIQTVVPSATVTSSGSIVRPPVTQLLHQTLTQRQALLKHQTSMAANTSATSLVPGVLPLSLMRKTTLPTRLPTMTLPSTVPTGGASANPVLAASLATKTTTATSGAVHIPVDLIQMTNLQTVSNTALPASTTSASTTSPSKQSPVANIAANTAAALSIPAVYPLGVNVTLSKNFAMNPILVTSLNAVAGAFVTSVATPVSSSVTPATASSSVAMTSSVTSTTSGPSSQVAQTAVSTTTVNPNNITNPQLAAFSAIRPFFAQNLFGSYAFPFIAAPATSGGIPLTTATITSASAESTTTTAAAATTTSAQVTTVPVVSLGQIPLTQIMSPMTVMSPAQLTSMLTTPLLKQFPPIPVIPSSLLQGGQIPLVKPVVVVTVPSVTTQPSSTETSAPVTSSSVS